MTKLLQQCFLFFIVEVIPGHNLGNSQVSDNRTIGPTLVLLLKAFVVKLEKKYIDIYGVLGATAPRSQRHLKESDKMEACYLFFKKKASLFFVETLCSEIGKKLH